MMKQEKIAKLESRKYSIEENTTKKKISRINLNDVANTILFLAVFVGIWQLTFILGIWPKVALPSPAMVAQSFAELNFSLLTNIAMTMWRLLIGFSISIVLGTGIGLAMVKFKDFGKTMSSFAVGLQSFPSIAWVPFSILFIGLNEFGILFVVIMSSIFSVMLSTYSGIRTIPPIYINAARNLGARGLPLFGYVMIPAATPSLIVGLTQAWSFAWHALIGAEILMAASLGLGHILDVGREFQLMDQIIASMITIFAIGLVFDRLVFSRLANKIRDRWGLNQNNE
jgi:NitT/TauT family transport system permease protein